MTWPLPTLGLFAGYGGLELGLERAGIAHTVCQVEIDPYCREIERRHWPHAARHNDVREVGRGTDGTSGVDLICGGFPCQPVSVAGKRRAKADERWLWPEFARIVSELRPAIVVAENVPGLRTAGLRDVLADLAALGFDAEWTCFRAWDLGAPHIRDRFWLVATDPDRTELRDEPGWLGRSVERQAAAVARIDGANGGGVAHAAHVALGNRVQEPARLDVKPVRTGDRSESVGVVTDADPVRRLEQARLVAIQRGWSERCGWTLDPAPRMDDGPAPGLDRGGRERARKAAGNGVVVACAEAVGVAIREAVEVTPRAATRAA